MFGSYATFKTPANQKERNDNVLDHKRDPVMSLGKNKIKQNKIKHNKRITIREQQER